MKFQAQNPKMFLKACQGKRLVLFGAGYAAATFINNYLPESLHVDYICDNDDRKVDTKLFGIDISKPERLKKENVDDIVVLITAVNPNELYEQVRNMGDFYCFVSKTITDEIYNSRAVYFHNNKKELEWLKAKLEDEMSLRVIEKIVENFQTGNSDFSEIITRDAYLINRLFDKEMCKDEVVIDAGAYNGDTVKKFSSYFGRALKKIYAIEPSIEMQEPLERMIANLCLCNVEILPYALSDKDAVVEFNYISNDAYKSFIQGSTDIASKIIHNAKKYQVVLKKLDDIIPVKEKITYIKMDIEGAEYSALLGARRIIQKDKPKLAICLYHNASDYTKIPRLIHDIEPGYVFYIRHHHKEHLETVIYAKYRE